MKTLLLAALVATASSGCARFGFDTGAPGADASADADAGADADDGGDSGRADGGADGNADGGADGVAEGLPADAGLDHDGATADGPRICSHGGWCWNNPAPTGLSLSALWLGPSGTLYVVGDSGFFATYRAGEGWRGAYLPSPKRLEDIWGASDSAIVFVGEDGTCVDFDGTSWNTRDCATTTWLTAVAGRGATDVFALGTMGATVHFDGTSWQARADAPTSLVDGAWTAPGAELYATSQEGAILHTQDGSAWVSSSASGQRLMSLWSDGAALFGVGNGGAVVRCELPAMSCSALTSGVTQLLWGVWGRSTSDVYIVGNSPPLHFDGSAFNTISLGLEDLSSLVDVAGDSQQVYAVSSSGDALRFTNSWSSLGGGPRETFFDVWAAAPATCYLAGASGIWRETGSGWQRVKSTASAVLGLWGTSASHVVGVGVGRAVTFDGSSWNEAILPPALLEAVWGTGPTDLWAVGWDAVLHFDGSDWSDTGASAGERFYGVWGSGADDVYAVGQEAFMHFDGTAWAADGPPVAGETYNAVWGDGPTLVIAVGLSGTAAHFDGSAWSTSASGAVNAVYGTSATEVFAMGIFGVIRRYDGTAWHARDSGTAAELRGVFHLDGRWLAVGDNGTVLERP